MWSFLLDSSYTRYSAAATLLSPTADRKALLQGYFRSLAFSSRFSLASSSLPPFPPRPILSCKQCVFDAIQNLFPNSFLTKVWHLESPTHNDIRFKDNIFLLPLKSPLAHISSPCRWLKFHDIFHLMTCFHHVSWHFNLHWDVEYVLEIVHFRKWGKAEFLSLQDLDSPRERISSVSGWSSPFSSPWRSRRSLSWSGLVCQGCRHQGIPLPQNGRAASLPWRIQMGGGVGEVRWGMAALAKGREEVDQEVVEGTSFPFAPPEKGVLAHMRLGN